MSDQLFQARTYKPGTVIDYTPEAAVVAGQVVVVGSIVAYAAVAIAAGELGALTVAGQIHGVGVEEAWTQGDAIYWKTTANPYGGTAGTGAFQKTASGATLAGFAAKAKASTDPTGVVHLTSATRTATLAGSLGADDIVGTDSTLTITGAPPATVTSAGGSVPIAGGIGGATSGVGGAVSQTGGAGTAGNSAGGAASTVGGAGQGSAAGGAASVVGGVGGATGAGGAVAVTGGAGGATSGTGGAVVIAAGAGSGGNANGGALTLRGGAKNGSGADGAIAIGDSNTASITMGKMPRIPTATVAAAGTVQGDAAAIVEGFTLVTGSTNAGVKLPSAVAGMQVIIKNNVGGNMKVWPNTSDAINAITADAAFTMATLTSCLFVAYDATTWYTIPLVAS